MAHGSGLTLRLRWQMMLDNGSRQGGRGGGGGDMMSMGFPGFGRWEPTVPTDM